MRNDFLRRVFVGFSVLLAGSASGEDPRPSLKERVQALEKKGEETVRAAAQQALAGALKAGRGGKADAQNVEGELSRAVQPLIDEGESLLKEFPESEESAGVYAMLSTWYALQRKNAEAFSRAEAFLRRFPEHPKSDEMRGIAATYLLLEAKCDEVLPHLEKLSAEGKPPQTQGVAAYHYVSYWKHKGDFGKAREALESAKRLGAPPLAGKRGEVRLSQIEKELGFLGKPVKPFEAVGTKGEKLSAEAFRGKVLLIDFWATWCGPCVAELPHVKRVYEKFRSEGFEVMGVSWDDDREAVERLLAQMGLPWPQCIEGRRGGKLGAQFGVRSLPATFLIDRNGVVRYGGLRGEEALESAVRKLLAECPGKK